MPTAAPPAPSLLPPCSPAPLPAVCALVATRTDGELQALLCGDALCHFDLSFFSSSTAPQFVAQLLSKVGGGAEGGGRGGGGV